MVLSLTLAAGLAASAVGITPLYPTVPMKGVKGNVPMPLVGLGTWEYSSATAEKATSMALKLGYRHVDTALGYGNQQGVGAALAGSGLRRDEYFVTSKVPGNLNASATTAALDLSLQQLHLDHVDLMLLHWPADGAKARQAQWLALEAWAKAGKATAIGISHYCRRHLDDILAVATLPVALNQVQFHVGMGKENRSELHDMEYMKLKGVVYMAYSSLCGPCPNGGNKELISGKMVTDIGKAHNKTGAQVSLRWVVQQGIPVIPKAQEPNYLAEDFALFDESTGGKGHGKFVLTDQEMAQLSAATSPPQTGTPPQNPDDDQDCLAP